MASPPGGLLRHSAPAPSRTIQSSIFWELSFLSGKESSFIPNMENSNHSNYPVLVTDPQTRSAGSLVPSGTPGWAEVSAAGGV